MRGGHGGGVCRIVSGGHQDSSRWESVGAVVGPDPISGVAGYGYTVNDAMIDLTREMNLYHRNWEEFADEE